MTREELVKYIAVHGSHSAAIMMDCKDCPLHSFCEGQDSTSSCGDVLEKLNSLRTKVSVIFEEEENNQVAIKDLPVGTFFIFCNRLYEVIKNAEGGVVKVKEWNTSEIGSFADEVKVEVVDIEIKVKKRKGD